MPVSIDDILKEASAGVIMIVEDSSQERDDAIELAFEKGLLKEMGGHMLKLSSLGKKVLEAGGYEHWLTSKMTRAEKIDSALMQAKNKSFIAVNKDISSDLREIVLYAADKGLLAKGVSGGYRLTDSGHDAIDLGGYKEWLKGKAISPSIVNNFGDNINGSNINSPNAYANNITSSSVTQPSKEEKKDFPWWIAWVTGIISAIVAIMEYIK
jgi:hypothetical protein